MIDIDQEFTAQLVALVEAGNYIKSACAAVGINSWTYYDWRRKAHEVGNYLEATRQELDPEFYGSNVLPAGITPRHWEYYCLFWLLDRAEANAEVTTVLQLRKHVPDHPRAAMFLLERRFAKGWRNRQTFEQVISDGAQIDEAEVIGDPKAVELMHDALEHVARGREPVAELPAAPDGVPKLDQDVLEEGIKKDPQTEV